MLLPQDMDIPAMRRDIQDVNNIRWLLRNLPIQNREHPLFKETMKSLMKICIDRTFNKKGVEL